MDAEEQKSPGGQSEGMVQPHAGRGVKTDKTAQNGRRFGQRGIQQGAPGSDATDAQHAAQGEAFGDFVKEDCASDRDRNHGAGGNGRHTPAINEGMDPGSDNEGGGKGLAVRTRRADRQTVAVKQGQGKISNRDQSEGGGDTGLFDQFGDQPQGGDGNQQGTAQRHEQAGPVTDYPDAGRGAGERDSCRRQRANDA